MDTNNWRPAAPTPEPAMENGDWRSQLQSESRQRIVNKIMETLKRHLPFSGQEGLQELKKIAMRFEEKIYTAATSQSDYLRKISLKMLTMETKSQNTLPNPLAPNTAGNSNKPPDPGGVHSMQPQVQNQGQSLPVPATSQSDYLRKISLKMLTMETKSQNPLPNPFASNSALNNNKFPDPGAAQSMVPQVQNLNQSAPSRLSANQHKEQLLEQVKKQKVELVNLKQKLVQLQVQQQNLLQPSQQSGMQPSLTESSSPLPSLQQNQPPSLQQSK